MPRRLAILVVEFERLGIVFNPTTLLELNLFELGQLCIIKTIWVIHGAIGVRGTDHTRAIHHRPLNGMNRHIARTRHHHHFVFKIDINPLEHALYKIDQAIASCLSTHQRPTVTQTFASKGRRGTARDFFHHTGHVADLATTNANITRRHIHILTNMTIQLQDKRLTKAHHLGITTATRIKVSTTLA